MSDTRMPVLFQIVARALAATAFVALSSAPARAADRNLKHIYDYVIEVDGAADKNWEVLAPEQKNRLLLLAPNQKSALLVSVAERSVRPVDRAMVLKHPDGTIDLLAGAVSGSTLFPLAIDGPVASFTFESKQISVKPRPPLLGPQSLENLIADRPNFGEGIKKYEPEGEVVSYLKEYPKPTEITVFFGSWCSVCEAWVPKFLKCVQECGNPNLQVKLIGVPRDFSGDQEIAKKSGIRGLPTFIIRQDGIEVGRIVGAPEKGSVEAAVAGVLRAKS